MGLSATGHPSRPVSARAPCGHRARRYLPAPAPQPQMHSSENGIGALGYDRLSAPAAALITSSCPPGGWSMESRPPRSVRCFTPRTGCPGSPSRGVLPGVEPRTAHAAKQEAASRADRTHGTDRPPFRSLRLPHGSGAHPRTGAGLEARSRCRRRHRGRVRRRMDGGADRTGRGMHAARIAAPRCAGAADGDCVLRGADAGSVVLREPIPIVRKDFFGFSHDPIQQFLAGDRVMDESNGLTYGNDAGIHLPFLPDIITIMP